MGAPALPPCRDCCEAALEIDRRQEARRHLARSLELSRVARDHSCEVLAHYALGQVEEALGRWEVARQAYREVIRLAREGERRRDEAKGWLGLAVVAIEADDLVAAQENLDRVHTLATETDALELLLQGPSEQSGGLPYPDQSMLLRFLPTGQRDASFGVDGRVTKRDGIGTARLHALAVQSDHGIVGVAAPHPRPLTPHSRPGVGARFDQLPDHAIPSRWASPRVSSPLPTGTIPRRSRRLVR